MTRVWVDTDIALGAPSGDVDDGFALALLARDPRLLGVTTVFGNTSSVMAERCAQTLLSLAGRTHAEVPVLRGASGPGQKVLAVQKALLELPRGTQVLCLGPLTNVALALQEDPSLAQRISVWMVGGNLDSIGRFPPYWPFEYNLAKDPLATQVVFAADGLERRLFPLPVCRRLVVGLPFLLQVRRLSALGAYLCRASLRWLVRTPLRYQSLRFPLWDVVPVLSFLSAISVTGKNDPVEVYKGCGIRRRKGGASTFCAQAFDPTDARRMILRILRDAT